jgi:hypothetical protein
MTEIGGGLEENGTKYYKTHSNVKLVTAELVYSASVHKVYLDISHIL